MNRRIVTCAIILLISLFATVTAETPVPKVAFPVKSVTAVEGNVSADTVWVVPQPAEKPVLGWVQDGRFQSGTPRTIIKGTAYVGLASGLALSVGGISRLFSAASDNFDARAMHSGLLMAVSGSLLSSLFSVLLTLTK